MNIQIAEVMDEVAKICLFKLVRDGDMPAVKKILDIDPEAIFWEMDGKTALEVSEAINPNSEMSVFLGELVESHEREEERISSGWPR